MINIADLSLTKSGKPILSHLSLQVHTGEKYLILGKSGSGKSSLFRLLLGFEKPDAGSITINGMAFSKETVKSIRGAVFYLSQDVELPVLTGEQILAETLTYNHRPALPEEQMALYLETLLLQPNLLRQSIRELSGGERQRLGLLLCFVLDRPIWLLDEPTSALDKQAKTRIASFIAGTDKTVLVISHDQVWQDLPGMILKEWH